MTDPIQVDVTMKKEPEKASPAHHWVSATFLISLTAISFAISMIALIVVMVVTFHRIDDKFCQFRNGLVITVDSSALRSKNSLEAQLKSPFATKDQKEASSQNLAGLEQVITKEHKELRLHGCPIPKVQPLPDIPVETTTTTKPGAKP